MARRRHIGWALFVVAACATGAGASPLHDHDAAPKPPQRESITDHRIEWPTAEQLTDTLLLRRHNTRVVILGVSCLGLAAGMAGTFLLLRKRSLTADALAHATLPGVAMACIVMVVFGGSGKSLPGLLAGAFVFGLIGMGWLLLIRQTTRLKDDAALGIVLSVMFGLGMALVKLAEDTGDGNVAGLNHFIYGRAASMVVSDAWTMLVAAVAIALICVAVFKEFKLLCFDQAFGAAQGWPVLRLDALLMAIVLGVTVVGLQAVGLLLVVAMLIIPAAAARFWTRRLGMMVAAAAGIGLLSGYLGAVVSALFARIPTGPVIVLVCSGMFGLSLVFGRQRGLVVRLWRHRSLARRIGRQHLLRALYEVHERADGVGRVTLQQLMGVRSWSAAELGRLIGRAVREGAIRRAADGSVALTAQGRTSARRYVRNHRLWEMYLIEHADIAPSHVDRDADAIEHVLADSMIDRLESLLAERFPHLVLPASPHPIAYAAEGGAS